MSLTWAPSLKHSDGAWVGVIFFFFPLLKRRQCLSSSLQGFYQTCLMLPRQAHARPRLGEVLLPLPPQPPGLPSPTWSLMSPVKLQEPNSMPKLLSERGKASPWGLLPLTQQVWGLQVKVDALPMVQAALGHWGGIK